MGIRRQSCVAHLLHLAIVNGLGLWKKNGNILTLRYTGVALRNSYSYGSHKILVWYLALVTDDKEHLEFETELEEIEPEEGTQAKPVNVLGMVHLYLAYVITRNFVVH